MAAVRYHFGHPDTQNMLKIKRKSKTHIENLQTKLSLDSILKNSPIIVCVKNTCLDDLFGFLPINSCAIT